MRKFFLQLLQNLDKLTGMKQYEKLCQTKKPKEEIKMLIDILCRVCDQFPFIPDEDKIKIINDAVIADQEFIGLNAKVVYKWLNLKREFYMKEKGEPEISPDALTGEAREKRLNEWLQALNKTEVALTERSDPYKTVREQWTNPTGEKYTPLTEQQVYERERHLEYIKQNYDARGNAVKDWIPEDEFNIQFDGGLIEQKQEDQKEVTSKSTR